MTEDWRNIVDSIGKLATQTLPREGLAALVGQLTDVLTDVNRQLTDVNRCAHCGEFYHATDNRSQFCSKSCKVMACRKRREGNSANSLNPTVNQHRLTELTVGGKGGCISSEAQPRKESHLDQGSKPKPTNQALFGDLHEETTKERAKPKASVSKIEVPMPPDLASDERFVEAWAKWQKYRREIGKRLTPTSITQCFAKFQEWGPAKSVAAIDHTILKGWQGLQLPDRRDEAPREERRLGVDVSKLRRPQGA